MATLAAVVTLTAAGTARLPDRPATGSHDARGAPEVSAADPFIDDEVLDEFVTPEQLVAVPVGPGRVAKPVQMVLSGAPVIRTLGESGIPDVAVRAYKQAEARLAVSDPGCGVPWTLLAAIGRVESNHGRFGGAQLRDDGSATRRIRGIPLDGRPNVALIRDSDGGALDGDTVYDRAVGPMQFIPSTWRAVNADANGDGFADPNNLFDAAQGAGQYLCTGTSNLRDPVRAAQAVRRYNNADSYVRVVLELARSYESGRVLTLPSTGDQLPVERTDPPAIRPWPTNPPPDDTVFAKPTLPQRTQPTAPPRADTRPRTTPPLPPRPTPVAPRPTKPVTPKPPATTTEAPTTPKPSAPTPARPSEPKVTEPQPSKPDPTRPPQPKPSEPPSPKPTLTEPKPTPTEPKPTEPKPIESEPASPEPTQTPEPKPSQATPSEPEMSAESGSPTPAPPAAPERKPTTVAVGWAAAMRQVVGRALVRPTCPPTRTPQTDSGRMNPPNSQTGDRSTATCATDSAGPTQPPDKKSRERCTPQPVCKVPGTRRPSAGTGR